MTKCSIKICEEFDDIFWSRAFLFPQALCQKHYDQLEKDYGWNYGPSEWISMCNNDTEKIKQMLLDDLKITLHRKFNI